eukprot:1155789-Pyramimonas_sp.AAC.1
MVVVSWNHVLLRVQDAMEGGGCKMVASCPSREPRVCMRPGWPEGLSNMMVRASATCFHVPRPARRGV